jgi:hypothetical protein
MGRGRKRVRCSHYPLPPCRRPLPAAPQLPPSCRLQRRNGAACIRSAAQVSITIRAHACSHTRKNVCTLSRFRLHTHAGTLSNARYMHTYMHQYARTHAHTNPHPRCGELGSALVFCTHCSNLSLTVSRCGLTDPGVHLLWRSSLAAEAPS